MFAVEKAEGADGLKVTAETMPKYRQQIHSPTKIKRPVGIFQNKADYEKCPYETQRDSSPKGLEKNGSMKWDRI